jgi:hypothetical protein
MQVIEHGLLPGSIGRQYPFTFHGSVHSVDLHAAGMKTDQPARRLEDATRKLD